MPVIRPYGKLGDVIYTLAAAKSLHDTAGIASDIILTPIDVGIITPLEKKHWRLLRADCDGLQALIQDRCSRYVRSVSVSDEVGRDVDVDCEQWFARRHERGSPHLLGSLLVYLSAMLKEQAILDWRIGQWLETHSDDDLDGTVGVNWTSRYIADGNFEDQWKRLVGDDRKWWCTQSKQLVGSRFIGFTGEYKGFLNHTDCELDVAKPIETQFPEFVANVLRCRNLYCCQSAALAIRVAAMRPVSVCTSEVVPDVEIRYDGASWRTLPTKNVAYIAAGEPLAKEMVSRFRAIWADS